MGSDQAYFGHLGRAQGAESPEQIAEGLRVWFEKAIPESKGKLLDFGAGSGHAIDFFAKQGFKDLHAYEPNPAFADSLSNKCTVHAGTDHEAFLRTQAASFDVIFAKDVLEHIAKDEIIPTAKLLCEALRPGGRLIVSVPHAVSFIGMYTRYDDFTHTISFTESSLRYVLESAGLSGVQFHGPRFRFSWNPVRMVYRALKWVFFRKLRFIYSLENPGSPNLPPHFYPRLVAVAQKK